MSLPKMFPSTCLKSVLHNGVGRYVCQLQRVTLKFCKESGGSRGVREFIETDLLDFTREHPGIVVYLLPRRFRAPILVGEYLNGSRDSMILNKLNRVEIGKYLELFRNKSGEIEKIINYHHTDNPSIQGVWNPFTRIPSWISSSTLPSEERSKFKNPMLSATEQVLQMKNAK